MTSNEYIKRLFKEHYDRMYLQARIILHDDEESRDVVSDVFVSIMEGSVDLRPNTVSSYLLTCVRNNCLKKIRAKQIKQRVSRLLYLDETIEMIPLDTQTDRLKDLLVFSKQEFTPQTLRVFQLRYQERKTYAEISKELDISEAAVYKHIAQALRKIKNHFNP